MRNRNKSCLSKVGDRSINLFYLELKFQDLIRTPAVVAAAAEMFLQCNVGLRRYCLSLGKCEIAGILGLREAKLQASLASSY